MSVLYPIRVSGFYKLCLRAFEHARIPHYKTLRSKKMYGNFVHVFLLVLKQRLGVSYRRLEQLASEFNLQRMLCIKRIPHYTTTQKALQRLSKRVFESMVRACYSLLGLKGMLTAIDETGFSNTNPSHYYIKRIDGVKVKNFTKTVLLADLNTKLVLNIKSSSDYKAETRSFIPLVRELKHALSCVLADKGYDAATNRQYCWKNNISNHIPVRQFKSEQLLFGRKPAYKNSQRRKAAKLFNANKYKQRAIIESIISAVKRAYGSWICSRKSINQQKEVTLKILAYNLDKINNQIKTLTLYIWTTILHRLNFVQI